MKKSLRKLRALISWPRLKRLARSPLHGGLQAAWAAWRERRRVVPPNDVAHTFLARKYPGSRTRRYRVHVPGGRTAGRALPLIMVLHGCRQDNADIEQVSGFNQLADEQGFLVVYPYITSYRGMRNRNCWGWWFDREIHAGEGEVEDLWQIIDEVCQNYPVDRARIHVTGLSSGAGMAVAMLVAHGEKIASGAAVAGVPYAEKADAVRHGMNPTPRNRPVVAIAFDMRAEMGPDARTVPIQIVHSRDDDKVDIQSAEVLRDSWGHCFGIDVRETEWVQSGEVESTRWEWRRYDDDDGRSVIETLFLDGPGHGWYGGNPGRYSFPDAPDIKLDMWRFFEANPLSA